MRLIAAIDVPIGAALILGGLLAHAAIFIAFGAVSCCSASFVSTAPTRSSAACAR
jgi:hypothetical protein